MFRTLLESVVGLFEPSPPRIKRRRTVRLAVEGLETRLAPAILLVTDPRDQPGIPNTLRDCVSRANDGDTIRFFEISSATITLNSEIASNKSLTIDGQTNNITISGNNNNRIFNFTPANAPNETI